MEKYRDKLKEHEESAKIQGAHTNERFFYENKVKRQRVYKRWYAVYMATTLTAVIVVVALILFGVGSNNTPFRKGMFSNIADKVVGWFAYMDFPLSDGEMHGIHIPASDNTDTTSKDTADNGVEKDDQDVSVGAEPKGFYDFDYSQVPDGHTPIIPMDLSLSQYGDTYINNSTGYDPDTVALISKSLGGGYEQLSVNSGPVVLIIHTHGTEAYSENGAISCPSDEKEYARTSDTRKNVVAVGEALTDELIKNGIPTAHCTILHDSVQYKDSYARAEETIKKYLQEYPSIKLVIDIHRDSIVKSSGEIVRPVAEINGEAAAQVMCVVGSDWAGDDCPEWQDNLALALKLRKELNSEYENLCRPPFLKGNTYNQEIAPYSLLLEIGAEGNSLEEAILSARLVGQKLALLVDQL